MALLKQRLLLECLNTIPEPERHAAVILAARESEMLSRLTGPALLLFPCLFAERAEAALARDRDRSRTFWLGMEMGA